jgi:hypothetical protein
MADSPSLILKQRMHPTITVPPVPPVLAGQPDDRTGQRRFIVPWLRFVADGIA